MANKQIILLISIATFILMFSLISATGVTSCLNITTAGFYNLSQNINSSGDCININASNVNLDCEGYTINATQRDKGLGVEVFNVNNVTIQHCNFLIQNSTGATSIGKTSIGMLNVTNSTIYNNTINIWCVTGGNSGSSCYGINLTRTDSINISNNDVRIQLSRYSQSIRIIDSNLTYLYNNNINGTVSDYSGIYALRTYFLNILNNTVWLSGTGSAMYLSTFTSGNVTNNTLTTLSANSGENTAGSVIYLLNSIKNNFTGNYLMAENTNGFRYGAADDLVDHINYIDDTNSFNGLPVLYVKDNNSFSLMNQISPYGQIIIDNSSNSNFYNVTFNNTQNGISIYFGTNITIDSSNLTTLYSGLHIVNITNSVINNSIFDTDTRYSSNIYMNTVHGNNIFTNLTLFPYHGGTTSFAITLSSSRYNQFKDITIFHSSTSSDHDLIYGVTAVGNYFDNININYTSSSTTSSAMAYGLYFSTNSWDNIINNSNIFINGAKATAIFVGTNKNNLTIINSNITCVKNDTLYISGSLTNSKITFINTNWSELNISASSLDTRKNMTIFNYNYLSVNVTETTTNLPVNQANVSIYFNNGTWVDSELTGTDGFVWNIPVLEGIWNNSANWTYQLNYTINVTKNDYANYSGFSINISQDQRADINITNLAGGETTDNSYPIFSNYLEYPIDPTEYSPDKLYNFSVTIINNNGTASIEFNGLNLTMLNLTDYFNRSIANLGAGTYYYYYWAYGNGTSHNYNITTNSTYTVNKNSSYDLALSVTSPITYGATTDFTGSGCPPQLSCSLNLTNLVFPAGTISANYSTVGNLNYTAKSQVATVTINKDTSNCQMLFNETSPLSYNAKIKAYANCGSAFTIYLNGTKIANNSELNLGAGNWNFTVTRNDTQNYTNIIDAKTFTINQATPNLLITIDPPTAINYPTSTNTEAKNCPNQLTCYFYRNITLIAGTQDELILGAGIYNYTYNTSGNSNYTRAEYSILVTVNKATTSLGLTGTTPIMYPTITDFTGTGCNAQIVCTLNITNSIFPVGTVSANYSTSGGQNYSGSSAVKTITINQNTTWDINLTASPSWTEDEGTETTITNNTACPSELICKLYRNNILVSNPDIQTLAIGIYNYTFNSTGNTNYSAKSISEILNITSLPDTSPPTWINLRNISHNINTEFSESITATDPSGIDSYVLNDTTTFQINKATGLITNKTSLMTLIRYNLNISVNDTLGNTAYGIFYIDIITSSSGNGTTTNIIGSIAKDLSKLKNYYNMYIYKKR